MPSNAYFELAEMVLEKFVTGAILVTWMFHNYSEIRTWWRKIRHDLAGATGNTFMAASEMSGSDPAAAEVATLAGMARELIQKAELGEEVMIIRRCRLGPFIKKAEKMSGIRTEYDFENDFSMPLPDDFDRLLLNLFQNAKQAGADKVLITARREQHFVRIKISDNGPGVPEQNRPKIFQDHFTTREKGTGTGLTIVRDILQKINGEIRLENTTEEKETPGASFVITIPLLAG